MIFVYDQLKNKLPDLNERTLTERDLYRAAKQTNIIIYEKQLNRRGYYVFDLTSSREYIFLKNGLDPLIWLEVAWHEMFHSFGLSEFESSIFSAIALIPRPALSDYSFLEENPTTGALSLYTKRSRIYRQYFL